MEQDAPTRETSQEKRDVAHTPDRLDSYGQETGLCNELYAKASGGQRVPLQGGWGNET